MKFQQYVFKFRVPFLLFLVVFVVYSSNLYLDFRSGDYRRLLSASDVVPNTFLPLLLIKGHTFIFNEQVQHLRRFDNWVSDPVFLINLNNNYYSVYPPLTGILAVPFYFIPYTLGRLPHIGDLYHLMKVLYVGRVTASFFAALSSLFVYLSLKEISKKTLWVLAFTLLYALGTTTWSISSRGLWQHTTSELFISVLVFLLLKSVKRPTILPLSGFVLGLAVLARPTNIVLAIILSFYVFFCYRKLFLKFILFALPCALFLLLYNYFVFGSFFTEGYGVRNDLRWTTPFLKGLLGFLFSPARSFLFISPPLVLCYWTIIKVFKNKKFGGKFNTLFRFLSLGFIFTMFLFSKWYTWHGGNGFGYRMLTGFLPIVVLLSFKIFISLPGYARKIIYILIIYSILIQFNAVFFLYNRCGGNHNWDFYCLKPRYISEIIKE